MKRQDATMAIIFYIAYRVQFGNQFNFTDISILFDFKTISSVEAPNDP